MSAHWNQVDRVEHKYLLDAARAARLQAVLERSLIPDGHNGAAGYTVRSLYLDTPDRNDFYGKADGLQQRQKLRLRTYDPQADTVLLEEKAKWGDRQRKRSWPLNADTAAALAAGDLFSLLQYPFSGSLPCEKLAVRRPAILIEYRRTAYLWPTRNIRITLDRDIRFSKGYPDLFDPSPVLQPLTTADETVLEVKFNGSAEPFIAGLLAPYAEARLSFGKYERCMCSR